jgi:hypothetical protein
MFSNVTGWRNTATGFQAMYSNSSGQANTAMGNRTLWNNILHSNNVAVGDSALFSNGMGTNNINLATLNTSIGSKSMTSNTFGYSNTAIGASAMYHNTIGFHNTAIGHLTLHENSGGDYNLAVGNFALQKATSDRNVAIGPVALRDNISGTRNVAVGTDAGQKNTGSDNVFIGFEAGRDNLGTGNVFIGRSVGNTATGSNRLMIDNSNTSTPLIQGDFSTNTLAINGTMGIGVATTTHALTLQNNSGLLLGQAIAYAWNTYSDKRVKSDIQQIHYGLKEVLRLRPVSYLHSSSVFSEDGTIHLEGQPTSDIGFVAQEVYDLIPEVVNKPDDESIALWSMNYTRLIPVLVQSIQELSEQNALLLGRLQTLETEVSLMQQQSNSR